MKNRLFPLGQVLLSRNVGDLIAIDIPFTKLVQTSLSRHKATDWGDCGIVDSATNDQALIEGSRLFSVYKINKELKLEHDKIWIITEADRSSTTILFPSDY